MIDDSSKGASPVLLLEWWKPILGYEGHYEISNMGNVYSLPRVKRNNASFRGCHLKSVPSTNLYPRVTFRVHGVAKHFLVHIIVATHFISPRPTGLVVHHIDGNKRNPRVSNLQFVTQRENLRMAGFPIGEANGCAILTEDSVREILRLKDLVRVATLAAIFGVTRSMIYRIHQGNAWKHLTRE